MLFGNYQGNSRIQEKLIAYLSKITKFAKNKWNLLKKDTFRLLIEGLTDCPVFTCSPGPSSLMILDKIEIERMNADRNECRNRESFKIRPTVK